MNAGESERLVLFDGVCGLCDRLVQWLIDHDPEARLRFAPLQGATAAALREAHPELPATIDTLVFVEQGKISLRSTAVFAIARHLPSPWSSVRVLGVLPRWFTDLGYRAVAAVRYRIWGRFDACRLPTSDRQSRFLP